MNRLFSGLANDKIGLLYFDQIFKAWNTILGVLEPNRRENIFYEGGLSKR